MAASDASFDTVAAAALTQTLLTVDSISRSNCNASATTALLSSRSDAVLQLAANSWSSCAARLAALHTQE